MRVLLLHNIVNPHMLPVFRRLAAIGGIDLEVAYFAASEGDRRWGVPEAHGFSSRVLPGRSLNLFFAWDTLSFHHNPGLSRRLREIPHDVLINAGWASLSNWQAFFACRRRRVPHVLWAGSTENEPSLRRTLTLPAVRRLVRGSGALVSYGTASARYLARLGASPSRIVKALHCVDNDRFLARHAAAAAVVPDLRRRLGLEGKRVVLFVGRLLERKGGVSLLHAFSGLAASRSDLALLLVGDGPARRGLESLAGREAAGRVAFAGDVALDDLPGYYRLAEVFVLPSLEEVWGLVVNEAALASLPLVVTRSAGASEDLVEEGVNGHVVEAGDVGALRDALADVLSDHERGLAMGRASRRIVERHSPAGVAAALARAARMAVDAGAA